MTCINCGSQDLPLGRPRRDGSRWPMRYCRACLWPSVNRKEGGREAVNRAHRSYRQRTAMGEHRVLGPCPCHDCGALVTFMGSRWVGPDGRRHWCPTGLRG